MPRNYTVHVFCPSCHDIFVPRSTRSASIDGKGAASLFQLVVESEDPGPATAEGTALVDGRFQSYHSNSYARPRFLGAYFGTTFPHLFLLTFPDAVPPRCAQAFVPRIFGFRIHKTSPYHLTATTSASLSTVSIVKRRVKCIVNPIVNSLGQDKFKRRKKAQQRRSHHSGAAPAEEAQSTEQNESPKHQEHQ
jgi:casein kinase II subunit beta